LMQFVPGTDFICSGYSSTPNYDNMFAGSNWDAEDYDDWVILQRDLRVDGGLVPAVEEDVVAVRRKAARAIQATFKELGLPEISDVEVEAATYAHGSKDMPARNVVEDLKAAEEMMKREVTGLDVAKALSKAGFDNVSEAVFNLLKRRAAGDYLHTAAIFDRDFNVNSAVNNPNDYTGPQTGYQITPEKWEILKTIRQAVSPESI
ncbi:MAG TPA: propanediol/glycerol family dehydratase large subunit, partial [Propioniciclava sp.]